MAEKRNVFLIGPMGAGKSTIGRTLAQMLGMKFIDSDHAIEEKSGANIEWIFDVEGEEGFRKFEEKILQELTQMQGVVLSTGGGSVLSKNNRNILSARGIVVYLETSIEKQLERTQKDKKRPLLQNNAEDNYEILKNLAQIREPLYQEIADITYVNIDKPVKMVAKEIIELIENKI